jgi:HK97 gp10 family phage protein
LPTPKSVVKINKDGVKYESFADQNQYYLFELTRAALRDVGKFVRKMFNQKYYETFQKKTGKGGKAIKVKVWSSKNTQYPRVSVGWKKGRADGFYSWFQEVGTKGQNPQTRHGILQKVVSENINEIIKIESQYLSGIGSEKDIDETEFDIEEGTEV